MSDDHAPNLDWSLWNYLVKSYTTNLFTRRRKSSFISNYSHKKIQIHFDRSIVQVFRIHIINDIVSNTMVNRNSKPVWCVRGIYIATCISDYTKVMYSLSRTFTTWMQSIGLRNSQRNKTLIFWNNINYTLFMSIDAGWSWYIILY